MKGSNLHPREGSEYRNKLPHNTEFHEKADRLARTDWNAEDLDGFAPNARPKKYKEVVSGAEITIEQAIQFVSLNNKGDVFFNQIVFPPNFPKEKQMEIITKMEDRGLIKIVPYPGKLLLNFDTTTDEDSN